MSAEVASFLDYLLAGGTGIEPAPCGFGVRLVPSTGVHSRPPHL